MKVTVEQKHVVKTMEDPIWTYFLDTNIQHKLA